MADDVVLVPNPPSFEPAERTTMAGARVGDLVVGERVVGRCVVGCDVGRSVGCNVVGSSVGCAVGRSVVGRNVVG